ncbi:MAG: flagellar biosynthesis anti-sigma factor FlgM [Desulfohalobiaceae bacterium]
MKITTIIDKLGTYEQQKLEKPGAKEGKGQEAVRKQSDTVTLSSRAKVFSDVQEAVRKAPEIRAEKIADIKARVAAGEYEPDPETIARKLLDEEEGLWP